MKFLKVRKGEEKQIIVDVYKNNKRPLLYSLTVKIGNLSYHECKDCIYNSDRKCCRICHKLENTKIIWSFVQEEFGISLLSLSLVPIKKIWNF